MARAGGAVTGRVLAALALGAAIALPLAGTRDLVTAMFFTLLYIVLALNYDLLGGFLGYMTLGQGAFFGLAAYVTVILLGSG
ncbi:MAG: branched-chain amino acid ABC transporter permease, partial [Candidatus Rokuibacteriota bacterium]